MQARAKARHGVMVTFPDKVRVGVKVLLDLM